MYRLLSSSTGGAEAAGPADAAEAGRDWTGGATTAGGRAGAICGGAAGASGLVDGDGKLGWGWRCGCDAGADGGVDGRSGDMSNGVCAKTAVETKIRNAENVIDFFIP
ncbi:hypothetical protein [Agrobacterium larrymoorei]|uniref:hypothetical protein n=1 Tax=Agrobacterium larrymoorei TaxID=160699 RepID=UPI00307F7B85